MQNGVERERNASHQVNAQELIRYRKQQECSIVEISAGRRASNKIVEAVEQMTRTQIRRRKQPDCEYVGLQLMVAKREKNKNETANLTVQRGGWVLGWYHAIDEKLRDGKSCRGLVVSTDIYNLQICAVDDCMRTVRIAGNLSSSL